MMQERQIYWIGIHKTTKSLQRVQTEYIADRISGLLDLR